MKLLISPSARKGLAALSAKDRAAMLAKLKVVAVVNPFGQQPGATAMAGGGYRLRHGEWRAICRMDRANDATVVDAVRHRREVYRCTLPRP